jgi:hypothetical protein
MTRTDGLVSGWPQTAGDASTDGEPRRPVGTADRGSVGRRLSRRGLLALLAALALIALAGPALALGTETSGYGQTAPAPKTTPTAKKGTEPSEKATTPTTTTPTASTEPVTTTTTTTAKASTLPFTGLDLRWIVGAGALMLAAGFSIRLAQGRRRHGPGG